MTPSPTPITKRLRKAQGESSATLHLLHRQGRIELYVRQRQRRALDYAVVRGALTAHGPTPGLALADLRAQLAERFTTSTKPLSWRTGIELGFPAECLAEFCQAYDLDPTGTTTPAELHRLVSQPGIPHRQAHIRALRRVGIHLK